jgi:hypothetical protein
MHRDAELRAQLFRKLLRLRAPADLVARHVQRIAHHRLRHPMLAQQPPNRLQVRTRRLAVERQQRLRRIPQRVRHGNANPPVAHIEPHDTPHQP